MLRSSGPAEMRSDMVTRDHYYIYHPFLHVFYFVLAKRKSWSHFDPEKKISLLEMFIAVGNPSH